MSKRLVLRVNGQRRLTISVNLLLKRMCFVLTWSCVTAMTCLQFAVHWHGFKGDIPLLPEGVLLFGYFHFGRRHYEEKRREIRVKTVVKDDWPLQIVAKEDED